MSGEVASGAFVMRPLECRADTGDAKILKTVVFCFLNLQSCLGSTGAFPGRVCSVFSSFCASGNPMTDSTLMWSSRFKAVDSRDFKGTGCQYHTLAWNCTAKGRRGEETSFGGLVRLQSLTLI